MSGLPDMDLKAWWDDISVPGAIIKLIQMNQPVHTMLCKGGSIIMPFLNLSNRAHANVLSKSEWVSSFLLNLLQGNLHILAPFFQFGFR